MSNLSNLMRQGRVKIPLTSSLKSAPSYAETARFVNEKKVLAACTEVTNEIDAAADHYLKMDNGPNDRAAELGRVDYSEKHLTNKSLGHHRWIANLGGLATLGAAAMSGFGWLVALPIVYAYTAHSAGFQVAESSQSARLETDNGKVSQFELKKFEDRSLQGEHAINQVMLTSGLSDEFIGSKSIKSHQTISSDSQGTWYQDHSPDKKFRPYPGSRTEAPLTILKTSDAISVEGLNPSRLGLVEESLPTWKHTLGADHFPLKSLPEDKWSDLDAGETRSVQFSANRIMKKVEETVAKMKELDGTAADFHSNENTVVVCDDKLRGELKTDSNGNVSMKTSSQAYFTTGEEEVYIADGQVLSINRKAGHGSLYYNARRVRSEGS